VRKGTERGAENEGIEKRIKISEREVEKERGAWGGGGKGRW